MKTFWLLLILSFSANAFEVSVKPPRYEIFAESGSTIRKVINLTNLSSIPEDILVKTQDWEFTEKGKLLFHDKLTENSCRPWVKIETHKIKLKRNSAKKFRFEISIPENTKPRECRFSISFDGTKAHKTTINNIVMPVKGSIGVIIYLSVDGAKSKLRLSKIGTTRVNGKKVPMLFINNTGNAHGRLSGKISGVDASKNKYFYSISTLPIMPSQTRGLELTPLPKDKSIKKFKINYPVSLKGTLFSTDGEIKVEDEIK